MRRMLGWTLLAAVVGLCAVVALAAGQAPAEAGANPLPYPLNGVHFVGVSTGFDNPVDIAFTPLITDTRMFVAEIGGKIRIANAGGAILPTPFLDVSALLSTSQEERGLLGLTFAPDYATSGNFYIYYVNNAGDLQLSRYQVSANPNIANPTGTPLLTIPHPDCENHNGGDLNFGRDGYLYLAPGDGGGQNDSCQGVPANDNDAQRLNSLLGKVLRINVTGVPGYTVPASNPFTSIPGARGEIWAMGLRNPWRFSFDRLTGDLYIGDVGQDQYEEINFTKAGSTGGENYGWRCYEGFDLYQECGTTGPYVPPVFAYEHGDGRAVVGGFVYRGAKYPALDGYYFFADNISGRFWARGGCNPSVTALGRLLGDVYPSTFGQDRAGEIYVADIGGGTVFRLVGPDELPASTPPAVQTPLFLPLTWHAIC